MHYQCWCEASRLRVRGIRQNYWTLANDLDEMLSARTGQLVMGPRPRWAWRLTGADNMDNRKRLAGVQPRSLAKVQWLPVMALVVAGCQPDHRVSFSQFLEIQRAVPAPEARVPGEERPAAIEVDRYLRPYTVGPSDVVSVTIVGAGDVAFPQMFQARVDREGTIDLPIAGVVKVADLELQDVEDAIRAAYVPSIFHDAVVHVDLLEVDSTDVLVVGAVTAPGLVPLRRTERSMLHAIVAAGGASLEASGQATLRRIRRPDDEATFNLRDPAELQRALGVAPLEHGDIVYVHAAQPNTVFVGGLVNRIGPQTYPPDTEITILQAVAAAGGLRTDVFPKEGTLVRRMPDGGDMHVKLDLNRLALGQDENIALAAGDILWVPETWETRVLDFINRNMFLRAGATVSYNVTGVEYMNRHSQQSAQFGGANQADISDPYGFLTRNSTLQGIQGSIAPLQP